MMLCLDKKVDAVRALRDAEAYALRDVADGIEPENTDRQWLYAEAVMSEPEHSQLLLISLMNAGLVRAVRADCLPAGHPWHRDQPPCPIYRYDGLTDAGRRFADDHGWTEPSMD
jgi:hypothetical protein